MTATNEAWISDSLARLEQLESQREQLAAAGRTEALAELDEEIKSLYEVLESAAEDEAAAANNSPATAAATNVPHPAFGPTPTAPSTPGSYAPQATFVPSAAPAMHSPFEAPAAPSMMPPPSMAPPMMMSSPSMDSGDDDAPGGGKGGLIAGLIVVVLAAGGGGWWYMNRAEPAPATTEAPAGPAKIIQAGAIPEDTQEPDVAKGGEASRTPGLVIKEPQAQSDDRRPSGPRPSGNSTPRPAGKPEKDGRSINVDASNDPLAGVK